MKEVKSPKKPLIYYYSIILLIVLLFNLIVSPLLMKNQVTEVDYGTFMRMIEEKNIGEVEVEDDEILFTDKDKQQVYTTGAMDDPKGNPEDDVARAELRVDGRSATGDLHCHRPVHGKEAGRKRRRQELPDVRRHRKIRREGLRPVHTGHPF